MRWHDVIGWPGEVRPWRRTAWLWVVVIGSLSSMPGGSAMAELWMPAVFGEGMVLQRGEPVRLWGRADPGERVVATFSGPGEAVRAEVATTAGAQGAWSMYLPAMPASSEPRTLTVRAGAGGGGEEALVFGDVLVGEVWFCSGQSNMQWPVSRSDDAEAEIAAASFPRIRLCTVARSTAQTPQDDAEIAWQRCSPETVGDFSAVAYYFGRALHRELGVPVGLIHSSWGGTPAEAWTSPEAMRPVEAMAGTLRRWDEMLENFPQRYAAWERQMAELAAQREREGAPPVVRFHTDPGLTDENRRYAEADFDDRDWRVAELPGEFGDIHEGQAFDGEVWFRRVVQLPVSLRGEELTLSLGPIDDFDDTFVDGQRVGAINLETPDFWQVPRRYTVPGALTADGRVTIAVRAFDRYGGGGFIGSASQLWIGDRERPDRRLSLAGPWRYRITNRLAPAIGNARNAGPAEPRGPGHPHRPSNLYHAMVHPVVGYTLAGFTWYQGEANAGRAEQYRTLLPLMISDWRHRWGQGDLPFGVVQLANFMAVENGPTDPPWAHLRDAQLHATGVLPRVGLAVTIDIGEANDIHPRNKQDVGRRLARWAMHEVYGKATVPGGPVYRACTIRPGEVELAFDDVGEGLSVSGGGELVGFTVLGPEGNWWPAKAEIVASDRIVVAAQGVSKPRAARYAWANNPQGANLTNSTGVPASPFRTDRLPGPTDGQR